MKNAANRCLCALGLSLLAACQSSNAGGFVYVPVLQANSASVEPISGYEIDPTSLTSTSIVGTLSGMPGIVSFSGRSGALDAQSGTIYLADGGTITLLMDGTSYVHRFASQPKGQPTTFGVIGIATRALDIPQTGQSHYSGTASIQIIDGNDLYDLSGHVSMTAAFSLGNATLLVSDLDGTRIDANGGVHLVNDAVEVTANSVLPGSNQFHTSMLQLVNSTLLNGPSSQASSQLNGAFFGPNASEIGATLMIHDEDAVPFALLGTLAGNTGD